MLAVILLLSGITYFGVKELTYSPLTEKDFKELFPDYDGNAKKECYVDFIGLSMQGELFDLSTYKLNRVTIDSQYPDFKNGWAPVPMSSDELFFSKWKKCPVDSLTFLRCKDLLTMQDFGKEKCAYSFYSDLADSLNYYSYLYVDGLECYFCLYCPDKNYLYYVRKRGW